MEIKVGEYVRTNRGNIGKLDEIRLGFNKDTQKYQDIFELDNGLWTISDYIVKHSFNIAELIKVNDFVNGHRVANIKNDEGRIEIGLETDHMINYYIEKEDIKTILTYEQHERNFYRLD